MLKALLNQRAIGVVTTHDLALTEITASANGFVRNMHFEDQVKDGKMTWGWGDVADEWGVAYGQVLFTPELKPNPNCDSDTGCQPYEQTPVSLVMDWRTLETFGK